MRRSNVIEDKVLFKVIERYVDPVTKTPLITDSDDNLCERGNTENILYCNDEATYDFTSKDSKTGERVL